MSKLDDIKQRLGSITAGQWEWRGRVAPDWLPDTFTAMDDLRVETPTPDEDWDAEVKHVIQPTKTGFVMVRNADAEFIANAPDDIRALLEVVEAAIVVADLHRGYQATWTQDYVDKLNTAWSNLDQTLRQIE